jgi:photosystem II stability/assembly factor-like uncharacterized protein
MKTLGYFLFIVLFLSFHNAGALFAQSIKSDPIYTIAISPQNPDIIYAGSKGSVYRIEKDEVFRLGKEVGEFLYLVANPANAKIVFTTIKLSDTTSFVLTTSDGGKSWQIVSISEVMKYTLLNHKVGNYGPIAIDPLNPKLISIGAEGRATMLSDGPYDLACLIFSTDGGKSWNISTIPRIGTNYPRPIHSVLSTSKTLFFSTPDGIFRMRNDVKKYDGCLKNSPKDVVKLIVDPANRDRILGITQDGKIYETVNNGDSFALLAETKKRINCIVIDPKAPKILWIGTDNGIFKSTDNGATWEEIGKGQIEPDIILSLAINPANSQLMYCGTNQGLFVSDNQGVTWQKYKTPAEQRAENLLAQAESLELGKEDTKAILLYKQVIDSFPSLPSAKVAEQKYKEVEVRIRENEIVDARKRIASVSEEKARSAISGLGLNEQESNALASTIENLSSSNAAVVMKEGLGIPLSDAECASEYRNLTLFQKFYAVLCYLEQQKEYLNKTKDEISEPDFWYQIATQLNIPEQMFNKLLVLKSENLLASPGEKEVKEKSPIAKLKSEYPDADISDWKEWAIVREPANQESGDMPAYIFKWEDKQWKLIAPTTEGFWSTEDVKEHIPNLTEEGAKKLGLTHK